MGLGRIAILTIPEVSLFLHGHIRDIKSHLPASGILHPGHEDDAEQYLLEQLGSVH